MKSDKSLPDDIIQDFPILQTKLNGKRLVYLDSTATSLKPRQVVAALTSYYNTYSANVFRGIYPLSEKATEQYEDARSILGQFISATDSREIIFTRNTTESINLIMYSWGQKHISEGSEIVLSIMEHHSNFVPWQRLAAEKNAKLKVWNINKAGELNLNDLQFLITKKTKILAISALSNVLGTINPIKEVVQIAKRINPDCLILVDAAQWVPHLQTNVQSWGADCIAFSGHKMLGPTGIGVLWAKIDLLELIEPFNLGGEMIREVYVEKTIFKKTPHKFEAGTPHIAGAIGLAAAVKYLQSVGLDRVHKHETDITSYAMERMKNMLGVAVLGPKKVENRGGILAFTIQGVHPHDAAQILADENICVRAGNHCAMPLHDSLGLGATVRASFYLYTTKADIDLLITGIEQILKKFK